MNNPSCCNGIKPSSLARAAQAPASSVAAIHHVGPQDVVASGGDGMTAMKIRMMKQQRHSFGRCNAQHVADRRDPIAHRTERRSASSKLSFEIDHDPDLRAAVAGAATASVAHPNSVETRRVNVRMTVLFMRGLPNGSLRHSQSEHD